MIVQNNLPAMNAHRNLLGIQDTLSKSTEKAATGFRINRAGDDAAGLAISEKMRAQIRGLSVSTKNTRDGINLIQTAEGALEESHSILQRMRELAVQATNGVYDNNVDNVALNKELERLKEELDRISAYTNFNNINLLDGNLRSKATYATREGRSANELLSIGIMVDAEKEKSQSYTVDLNNLRFDFSGTSDAADIYTIDFGGGQVLTSRAVGGKTLESVENIAALFDGKTLDTANATYTAHAIGTKLELIMTTNNGANVGPNNAEVAKADLLHGRRAITFDGGTAGVTVANTDLTNKLKEIQVGTNAKNVHSTLTRASFDALRLREGDTLSITERDATGNRLEHSFRFTDGNSDPTNRQGAGSTFTTIEDLAIALNSVVVSGLTATANNETGIFIVPASAASVTDIHTKLSSIDQAAESIITFYDGVRSGTTINIQNETYELVARAEDAIRGNHAVVVNALSGGAALTGAQAAAALDRYLTEHSPTGFTSTVGRVLGVNDNSVIISTLATGAQTRSAKTHVSSGGLTLQIGANGVSDQRVNLNVESTASQNLGVQRVFIETQYDARQAIDTIDKAIGFTSSVRSELGALQNRLEHTVSSLSVSEESLMSAESRIRDVDLAKEMMVYAKSTILSLSTRRMLANANIGQESVLNLLK